MLASKKHNLELCFKPKSIAIIGASRKLIGGRPMEYLSRFGYKGKVFPVNPKYPEIGGLTCYPSLSSIPEQVDMAIIAIPASGVLASLQECIDRGVKSAVVFSSGFAETGAEGRKIQESIAELSRSSGMAILGPNCQGLANLHDRAFATFSGGFDTSPSQMKAGSVAFVSQSGAFGGMLVPMALDMGVHFSYWVTTGNEAGLRFSEIISYMAEDPNSKVIAGYIETVRDGKELLNAARLASENGKPLIVTKVGRSQAGAKAALSHTGAMMGSDEVYEAVFKQVGIIRANDTQELLDFMYTFSLGRRIRGKRIAIVSLSGGIGILMADMCSEKGLEVLPFSSQTSEALKARLPAFGSAANPVDVTGQSLHDPSLIGDCLRILVNAPEIDGILVLSGMVRQSIDKFVADISEINRTTDKPMVVTWMSIGSTEVVQKLRQNDVPTFDDPRRAVNAMHALVTHHEICERANRVKLSQASECVSGDNATVSSRDDVVSFCKDLLPEKLDDNKLTEYEAKRLLATFGMPVPSGELVRSADEAARVANELGYPVALKLQSPQFLHKTDAGGVKLNLKTADEVRAAFDKMFNTCRATPGAECHGVLVEEMLGGTEVIVGMSQDPVFGPVILFGLGGIFVEVLKDVSRRVAPLSRVDAEEMIAEIKGRKILEGVRGKPAVDSEAIIQVLLGLSDFSMQLKDVVAELDINPLMVGEKGQGARVADARIVLK